MGSGTCCVSLERVEIREGWRRLVAYVPEVPMTCANCSNLQHRIAYLERELGLKAYDDEFATLKAALGIEVAMVRVVLRLYAAQGRWVSKDALMTVISTNSEPTLHTRISCLRRIVGRDIIEPGARGTRSYKLTSAGIARIDGILGKVLQ